LVIGPSGVPEIIDSAQAQADPELAVLSAIAHGRDADVGKSVRIALAAESASAGLDEDRSKLYLDLILASLSEAARTELQTMKPAGYQHQSDFAKHYVPQGRAEGRAALVLRLLTLRFGPLQDNVQDQIARATVADLDAIGERLLTAETLLEALDSH
jgi:hypothetical protein